mgnify:FL=1
MDIFSHGLWSYAIFHRKKYALKAVLAGILPDILSFGPHFILSIFAGSFVRGKPSLSSIPEYVSTLYNLTHSLIIFTIVVLLIYIFFRKFYIWLLAWPLHTFVDIFTHDASFFPTPFLYPISNYRFNGYSWGHPKFLLIDYSLIVLVYIFIFYSKKRKKK